MRISRNVLAVSLTLLAVLLIGNGCSRHQPPADKKEAHAHPEEGPNGGPLAELGEEEYHAELKLSKGKATVYILDGEAKTYVPIEEKEIDLEIQTEKPAVQLKLKAVPQEKDKNGASRFEGEHEKLTADLNPEKIEVSVKFKGKAAPLHGHFGHSH